MMSIDELGSVGEIVGAIATILTLIYLSLQIRQSNIQTKSEAHRVATQAWVDQQRSVFETPEKVAFMRKAMTDYDSLSQDEKGVFFGILLGYIAPFANIYDKFQAGLMEPAAYQSIEEAFTSVFTTPGARACINSFEEHTMLPPYIMKYVNGDLKGRTIPPMTESFDFMIAEAGRDT